MKTLITLIALFGLGSCAQFDADLPDGGKLTVRHHPAGLACGFPEGTHTSYTPPPKVSSEK